MGKAGFLKCVLVTENELSSIANVASVCQPVPKPLDRNTPQE